MPLYRVSFDGFMDADAIYYGRRQAVELPHAVGEYYGFEELTHLGNDPVTDDEVAEAPEWVPLTASGDPCQLCVRQGTLCRYHADTDEEE